MPAILERPPILDPPNPAGEALEQPPRTATRRRRHWLRYLFPWVKTAIGAPIEDDALIIMNATGHTWSCAVGFRSLGLVAPHDDTAISVVRRGLLTARRLDVPDDDPLALAMTPSVRVVQITSTVIGGAEVFTMWAVSSPIDMTRGRTHPVI